MVTVELRFRQNRTQAACRQLVCRIHPGVELLRSGKPRQTCQPRVQTFHCLEPRRLCLSAFRSLDYLQQLSRPQNHGNQTGLRTRIYDEKLSEVHHQRQPAGEITQQYQASIEKFGGCIPLGGVALRHNQISGFSIVRWWNGCDGAQPSCKTQNQSSLLSTVFHLSVDSRLLWSKLGTVLNENVIF